MMIASAGAAKSRLQKPLGILSGRGPEYWKLTPLSKLRLADTLRLSSAILAAPPGALAPVPEPTVVKFSEPDASYTGSKKGVSAVVLVLIRILEKSAGPPFAEQCWTISIAAELTTPAEIVSSRTRNLPMESLQPLPFILRPTPGRPFTLKGLLCVRS